MAAFEAFPSKDYCLLTLPHGSPEPPLVSCFTRLAPMPGAAFPEVLYLFHRYVCVYMLLWNGEGRAAGTFAVCVAVEGCAERDKWAGGIGQHGRMFRTSGALFIFFG
jgi:hypothetical protein